MKRSIVLISIILFLFVSLGSLSTQERQSNLGVGDKAPNFILKDAADKSIELANWKEKVIVLFFSNQDTKDVNLVWSVPIYYAYKKEKEVKFISIANMEGMPFFVLKGRVKEMIKKSSDKLGIATPFLDWKGKVYKLYQVGDEHPVVFIIDKERVIQFRQEIDSPVMPTDSFKKALEQCLEYNTQ